MTERSYEDAVQVLQRRIGAQWDGLELDGRAEMAKILKHELGYDQRTAEDAIAAMIQSGQLRYHRAGASGGTSEVIDDSAKPIAMSPNATGTPGLPGAGFEPEQGPWAIVAENDTDWEGRAGQATPR